MRFLYFKLILLLSLSTAIAQQKPVSCGTSDEALPRDILDKMARLPAIMEQQKARLQNGEMNICRIGVEIDYETYIKFEQDTNLIFRQVQEDIRKVSEVYEREINTRMVVTSIRIFKTSDADPFAKTYDIFELLSILAGIAPANQDFDKRVYLFTKTVMGAGGVGNLDGKYSVTPLGNPRVAMHEFGHNFSSPHTHNCSWPGGPIDFCANIEGTCYDKALEALQDNSGTLMSYCERESTFHPLCQALMRDHADRLFTKITSTPAAPELSANMQVSRGDFLYWNPSTAALSYEVTYATNADFSGSKTASVPFNGFQIREAATVNTLFIKIRALNGFGASSWSQPVSVKIGSEKLSPPEINVPATPPIFENGTVAKLSYSSVPGATSYEIQIGNPADALFESPYLQLVSTTSEVQYTAVLSTILHWRVRAVNEQGHSKWSEPGYFSINPTQTFPLSIPFYRAAPRTFPFSYSPSSSHVKVRVSVASNRDFSNAIFMKEYNHVGPVTDVISNLPANSSLFFRLEEWNEDETYYPKTKIKDYIFPFSTENTTLPAGLTFLSSIAPDVFNHAFPRIVPTSKNIWLASRTKGFVRVDRKDFKYQVLNRGNTDGHLGYLDLPAPIQATDSQKVMIMSFQTNSSFLRSEFSDDKPSKPAPLNTLKFIGYISGNSPLQGLYWGNSVIYKEVNNALVPLKTFNTDWIIRKVIVRSDKAWILTTNYRGQGEITVIETGSGTELERINSTTHPELLPGMESFLLGTDGKMMILQYDPATTGNRISMWDNQTWTTLDRWDPLVSAGTIQSIASSRSGEFYALVSGRQTRILKYNGSKWEPVGTDIPLQDLATNMEIDADDNFWLSGWYGLARLTPTKFDLISTDKADYCANDSVTLSLTVTDQKIAAEKFTVVLTKTDGQSVSIADLGLQNQRINFKIPDSFAGNDIELKAKTMDPELAAPTSLHVNVRPLPTAKLSIDKPELIPLIDTATITIALTGEKPWVFFLSNQDSLGTELPVYKIPFTLSQQADLELSITRISDRYCTNYTQSNVIRIIANSITGVAEPTWPKVSIYPNPSSDKIVIQHTNQNGKPAAYYISDIRGNILETRQILEKLTEWDISKLGAGNYILWTVHHGHKRSWKIVKN